MMMDLRPDLSLPHFIERAPEVKSEALPALNPKPSMGL